MCKPLMTASGQNAANHKRSYTELFHRHDSHAFKAAVKKTALRFLTFIKKATSSFYSPFPILRMSVLSLFNPKTSFDYQLVYLKKTTTKTYLDLGLSLQESWKISFQWGPCGIFEYSSSLPVCLAGRTGSRSAPPCCLLHRLPLLLFAV